MYEEIIWALKQKKEIAEQAGDLDEVERFKRMMKEEEERKSRLDAEMAGWVGEGEGGLVRSQEEVRGQEMGAE